MATLTGAQKSHTLDTVITREDAPISVRKTVSTLSKTIKQTGLEGAYKGPSKLSDDEFPVPTSERTHAIANVSKQKPGLENTTTALPTVVFQMNALLFSSSYNRPTPTKKWSTSVMTLHDKKLH